MTPKASLPPTARRRNQGFSIELRIQRIKPEVETYFLPWAFAAFARSVAFEMLDKHSAAKSSQDFRNSIVDEFMATEAASFVAEVYTRATLIGGGGALALISVAALLWYIFFRGRQQKSAAAEDLEPKKETPHAAASDGQPPSK